MMNASSRLFAYVLLAPACLALAACDTLSEHIKPASYQATASIATPRTQAGDKIKAESEYQTAVPVIDRMARKGLIHANKAARHKSRLTHHIRDMQS